MTVKKRIVCSVCASEKKSAFCNYCKEETPGNESIEMFGKHRLRGLFKTGLSGKGRKASLDIRSGWKKSGDPKKKPVYEDRIINRKNDEYHHVVRDAETGKILHEEHKPLSKHKKNE